MLSCCCFSAGFLWYLGIVPQSMSPLFFSCLFNLLVVFSICFAPSVVFFFCFSSLRLLHSFSMLSVTQGFFAGQCLPRMLLAVSVTAMLKLLIKASILVSWFSRARSGANFPPIVAQKKFCNVEVLEFLQTEPDPYVVQVFNPLEAESEGHQSKLMVTSDISTWKAPGLCTVHT